MTKSTITREQLIKKAQEQIEFCRHTKITGEGRAHVNQCAALFEIALAAMDSESGYLPLDYLQGHKDGLEWAAQLAEANHPETGDWLYDDPIELAKAIRKGPDMPPAQPVADSEPVIVVGDDGGDALSYRRLIQSFEPGTKLYLHAQPAPVVSGWIPVSERLPEEGGRYWCYVEEQNSLGKSHYQWNCSWNGDRWWVESEGGGIVTHWMPLPACPAGGER
ncbi:hypothetical protein SM87_01088 [Klebsiella pneumoniae]|nr:hypothetical protein SM87_01088 [Klebsiella pneumoniae]